MQFINVLVASLLAGSALAVNKTAALKQDITDLGAYLDQLNGDTNQFKDTATGIPFALQVQIDAVNIDKVLLRALSDAQQSDKLSDGDSLSLGLQLVGVSNKVNSTLVNVGSKAGAFGDLRPIVLKSLYNLKADTDAFGKAFVAKLALLEQAIAGGVTTNIDNAFNRAIVQYGGKAS